MHLPSSKSPDAVASGWRRHVQVARLKALRPTLAGFLNTPTPARDPRRCRFTFLESLQRGFTRLESFCFLEMHQRNFSRLESFSF